MMEIKMLSTLYMMTWIMSQKKSWDCMVWEVLVKELTSHTRCGRLLTACFSV